MFNKRKEVILLVFGKGGHTAQMQRFLANQPKEFEHFQFVTLTNSDKKFSNCIDSYYSIEARDKFSWLKNVVMFFVYIILSLVQTLRIILRYKVVGMISTGPGMAILPAVVCRLLRIKVVYFESWSRISKPAIAGRIMYYIANLFFIQHQSIKIYYPNAVYMGRL